MVRRNVRNSSWRCRGQALAEDLPGGHVQGREQRRGPVALVLVRHRPGPALDHRQGRLGAVQRLDLGLLVHAQHHGLRRWAEIQAHDVDELGLEGRVVRQLERVHAVRLETAHVPDPLHRRRAHPDMLGHHPARPVRVSLGDEVQREVHDLVDLLLRDRCLAATTLGDLAPPGQPLDLEASAPSPHRHRRHANVGGDPRVRDTVGSGEQRPRPDDLTVRRGLRPCDPVQRLALARRHRQRGSSVAHPRRLPITTYLFARHTTSRPDRS
jgi:hypothetical protein